MNRILRSHWTQAVLVASLLAIAHSWPLATDPARLSLNYNGDVMLNEWILAWVQHQLPRDPLHLFSANIFYPAPDSLAFSEPLIVPALMGAPIRILGGSPVLVHNLLLLAGMALTMLGAYALVHAWTGDHLASLLAGSAWAFNTQSLERLPHLQAHHAYAVPLALLAADRMIETGRKRHALLLAFWMAVMAYTSGYLVVFTTIALAVLVIIRLRSLRTLASFALAAAIAAIAILPVYLPYRRVANQQHMVRTLDSVTEFSAMLNGYLASYSHLHDWLWNAAAPRQSPDAYFPGIVVLLLGLTGIGFQLRTTAEPVLRRRVLVMVGICLAGCLLSLGTRTPVYGWLYAVFPPLAGLRAAARFGVLFMLGSAVLGGIGLAALRRQAGASRLMTVTAAVLVVLVNVEALHAPFQYRLFNGIPGIYAMLADEPGPVVLIEVPFYPPHAVFENAEYMLNSTAHWRPLMNGYSGYTPGSYRDYAEVFWYFPDSAAVDAIRAAGATHLVVHPDRFGPERHETLQRALADPRLERLAVGRNNITLFRIK